MTIQPLIPDLRRRNSELVSEFEVRRHEIKGRLQSAYAEVTAQATEEDEMTDLKEKARGLFAALEFASTRAGLDRIESGILSLKNDLSRARMALRL